MFILDFMTILGCNIFIYFISLAISKMGTLFVYIQPFVFLSKYRKTERIFSFSYILFIFSFYNMIFIS